MFIRCADHSIYGVNHSGDADYPTYYGLTSYVELTYRFWPFKLLLLGLHTLNLFLPMFYPQAFPLYNRVSSDYLLQKTLGTRDNCFQDKLIQVN